MLKGGVTSINPINSIGSTSSYNYIYNTKPYLSQQPIKQTIDSQSTNLLTLLKTPIYSKNSNIFNEIFIRDFDIVSENPQINSMISLLRSKKITRPNNPRYIVKISVIENMESGEDIVLNYVYDTYNNINSDFYDQTVVDNKLMEIYAFILNVVSGYGTIIYSYK